MANVFQVIAKDKEDRWFDKDLVDSGDWHAKMSIDDPRTVCGIQLVGEDDIAQGAIKEGK